MSGLISLRLLGAKKLEKKLNKLENKVKSKAMRDAAKTAMAPVAILAKSRVPVDTGRLQRSIKVATFSAKRGDIIGAQVRTGTRKQLRIPEKSEYYYPAAIEYGTSTRGERSFLRSAMGDKKSAVIASFSGILAKVLAKI